MLTVVEFHSEDCVRTVIMEPKKKYIHVVTVDRQVCVKKVPHSDIKYMTPIDYPLRLAKRVMRDTGRRIGITKAAKKMLRVNG